MNDDTPLTPEEALVASRTVLIALLAQAGVSEANAVALFAQYDDRLAAARAALAATQPSPPESEGGQAEPAEGECRHIHCRLRATQPSPEPLDGRRDRRVDWPVVEQLVDAAILAGTVTASRGAEILGLSLPMWRQVALGIRENGNPFAAGHRPTGSQPEVDRG